MEQPIRSYNEKQTYQEETAPIEVCHDLQDNVGFSRGE